MVSITDIVILTYGVTMKSAYLIYLGFLFLVIITILIAPAFALINENGFASFIYNVYVPTCHQWIYRSSCIFSNGNNYWIGNCIDSTKNESITTQFTSASKRWDGVFNYSRDQIGLNRAEKVEYRNVVGYKFANDDRNIGLYLFMFLGGTVLPFVWKKPYIPYVGYLVLGILPFAIDGTGQLLGFWESTNIIRFVTGAIAGIAATVYVYAFLNNSQMNEVKPNA